MTKVSFWGRYSCAFGAKAVAWALFLGGRDMSGFWPKRDQKGPFLGLLGKWPSYVVFLGPFFGQIFGRLVDFLGRLSVKLAKKGAQSGHCKCRVGTQPFVVKIGHFLDTFFGRFWPIVRQWSSDRVRQGCRIGNFGNFLSNFVKIGHFAAGGRCLGPSARFWAIWPR